MHLPSRYSQTLLTPDQSRRVETIWSYTAEKQSSTTILPDGRCDLILQRNFKSDTPLQVIMTGPATTSYAIEMQSGDSWVGLRMRPTFGGVLWGDAIRSARDTALRGNEATTRFPMLAPEKCGLPDVAGMAVLLNAAQDSLAFDHRQEWVSQAVSLIHLSGGRMLIEGLSSRLNCSPRQLNRGFLKSVGLPAKSYAGLVQFHRALGLVQRGVGLAAAAFEAGYADQAHMTRAMRTYGGFVPSKIPTDLMVPVLLL